MSKRLARYQQTLSRLERSDRRRILTKQHGIDFTSNDYLALTNSERMRDAIAAALENGIAVGSGGSRLLRGNHDIFEALESEAAAFFHSDRTLYFGSGYAANMAIFSVLPQHGDMIFYDERVHASVLDGIAASRAEGMSITHNEIDRFTNAIKCWRKRGGLGRPWIAVESLYSMDGDCAPINDLFELANHEDGFLVIDEAHATGVFGADGRGLSGFLPENNNVIVLHTCGKALGVSGALICLNQVFYDYLINRARTLIYSTAPSPLMAAGVREALKILVSEPERRIKLRSLYRLANEQSERLTNIAGSGTQILPVVIGDNQMSSCIAARMQVSGFDIRAIRPPTVPEGTARLRVSITLHIDEENIRCMFAQLSHVMNEEQS